MNLNLHLMIDFREITKTSKLYNFHSHTQFCDGRAAMEQFVVEAVKQGFTDYAFTPHSPIPFASPCNMSTSDVPTYIAEYNRLKSTYGGRINLYLSMEIDYIGKQWGASSEYFQKLPLDFRLSSVHFIPSFADSKEYIDIDGHFDSFRQKMGVYFNNDIESVVRSFYSQSIAMIEAGGFDVIGHFDKIGHNAGHFREGIENEAWYVALVEDTFEAIMDNHLIIEVNTKALKDHRRTFPNKQFYYLLKRYNAPLLINSDAHYPELINAGRIETMETLAENGLYKIV